MNNTLTHLIAAQALKYGSRTAITGCDGPDLPMAAYSWQELQQQVSALAAALLELHVAEQDHIAIFSDNMPQVVITDFAAYAVRAVPVSIYATSSFDQVKYIVNDSRASLIFVGNQEQYHTAVRAARECPSLRQIVCFGSIACSEHDHLSIPFEQLLKCGADASERVHAEVARRTAAARPDDVATLIYTSGTTGEPKGAILPHSCFDAALAFHHSRLPWLTDADTSLCFLPLSHIFEKAWTYYCLFVGIHVTINSNPKEIQKAIRRVRPTCMCSVPRFWEKAFMAINEQISKMGMVKRTLVLRGIRVGQKRNLLYVRRGLKVPALLENRYRWYDKRVFAPIRKAIGVDRGHMFPTAGAPLAPSIVTFFHSIGINILIGYGLSETTATVTLFPDKDYRIGSVGKPLPGVEVRIGRNSEVLVKGPTVMRGYFNKPQASQEAFTPDGWFRTGDAGRFDDDGNLWLTDRIKDLFKTSNGKYIAPQVLESRLGQDPYFDQVAIIGDNRKYVTALIVPAFNALEQYARKKQIQYDSLDHLVKNADIMHMIGQRIERLQQGLPAYERIKRFTLLSKPFTMESGELTNTLKIRRPVINEHYATEIDAMYSR